MVGPETWATLEDEEDEAGRPILALGAIGTNVRELQEALVALDWEIDVGDRVSARSGRGLHDPQPRANLHQLDLDPGM